MKSMNEITNASGLWNLEASFWSRYLKDIGYGYSAGILEEKLWNYFDVIVSGRYQKYYLLRSSSEQIVFDDIGWKIDIEGLLRSLFSEEYLMKLEFEHGYSIDKCLKLESAFPSFDEVSGKISQRVFHLMEERECFRVSLVITPIKRDLKVSITPLEEQGIRSLAETFFHWEFDPWGDFNRIVKRDDLNFMERQGWAMYPRAYNNYQFFEILFGANQLFQIPDQKVSSLSAMRQKKFLIKYLKLLQTAFGNDVFDSHAKEYKQEDADLNIWFRKGRRIFCLPECDIVINFKPIEMEGFVRNELLIGGVSVHYSPRLVHQAPVGGYYLHPIVYEAGK